MAAVQHGHTVSPEYSCIYIQYRNQGNRCNVPGASRLRRCLQRFPQQRLRQVQCGTALELVQALAADGEAVLVTEVGGKLVRVVTPGVGNQPVEDLFIAEDWLRHDVNTILTFRGDVNIICTCSRNSKGLHDE